MAQTADGGAAPRAELDAQRDAAGGGAGMVRGCDGGAGPGAATRECRQGADAGKGGRERAGGRDTEWSTGVGFVLFRR